MCVELGAWENNRNTSCISKTSILAMLTNIRLKIIINLTWIYLISERQPYRVAYIWCIIKYIYIVCVCTKLNQDVREMPFSIISPIFEGNFVAKCLTHKTTDPTMKATRVCEHRRLNRWHLFLEGKKRSPASLDILILLLLVRGPPFLDELVLSVVSLAAGWKLSVKEWWLIVRSLFTAIHYV